MICRKAICTYKDNNRILFIGCEDGIHYHYLRVISMYDNKEYFYTADEYGNVAVIHPFEKNGNLFLKTAANGKDSDNLERLPSCHNNCWNFGGVKK